MCIFRSVDEKDEEYNEAFCAKFMIEKLTIAHSTASCERIFSMVTAVHTKIRNRLKVPSVESILRIRLYLKNRDLCCHNFEVTKSMLSKHNSNMYHDVNEHDISSLNDIAFNQDIDDDIHDH